MGTPERHGKPPPSPWRPRCGLAPDSTELRCRLGPQNGEEESRSQPRAAGPSMACFSRGQLCSVIPWGSGRCPVLLIEEPVCLWGVSALGVGGMVV